MMRRWPVAGLVSVLLVGIVGCTGDDPAPRPSPSLDDDGYVRGSVAPDGGRVRVVESGYSTVIAASGRATFGVILENTSKDRAAVGVRVTASFFDAAGNVVPLFGIVSTTSEAAAIPPGGRTGVGDDSVEDLRGMKPDRVRLRLRVAGWRPASRVAGVVAGDVKHSLDGRGVDHFSFTVDSRLREPLFGPQIFIILRDSGNKVIGGLNPQSSPGDWPPGRSPQRVQLSSWETIPEAADLARTEVFIGNAEIDTRPR
jgi:hypothetical protein